MRHRTDHPRWVPPLAVRAARHPATTWAVAALALAGLLTAATDRPPREPGPHATRPTMAQAEPDDAGLVPDGRVGVAVPIRAASPPMAADDRVDLVAVVDPYFLVDAAPVTTVVARRAIVLAVSDDTVTLAVDRSEVLPTVTALVQGAVTPVLVQ